MSRIDAATQTGNSGANSVNYDLADFTCPVTQQLFFDPVSGCNPSATCGHTFEKKECVGKLQKCPCCREDITLFSPALHTKNTLDQILASKPELWQDVYFNLDHFAEVFAQPDGLKTPSGLRFCRLLENALHHLNDKAVEGTQRGKSAIEILTSTRVGRDLLRTNSKMRALILPESLAIQVDGKSIREWLDPTAELLIQEKATREAIIAEQTAAFSSFLRSKCRLFSDARGAHSPRTPCEAVNAILQEVVNGQRIKVREMLERLKCENAALLQTVLTSVATASITDYSGKKIENLTLLQAAAAAGDVSLHPELVANDRNHEGMCEIIQSYFSNNAEGQSEMASQLSHIFPNGIEAHETEQKHDTFNFDAIIAAILRAPTADLDRALGLDGARFDELNDATRAKPTDQLTLTEALNRYREQFTKKSMSEETFNPHHLLKAFELYNAMWEQCERDGTDRDYKKRDLFWRQVIGFAQRFLPACYAQAFAQGLYYLVKVDQSASWRPEILKCAFDFKYDPGYRFYPLSSSCTGLGFECLGVRGSVLAGCAPPVGQACRFYKTYVEQKHRAWRAYAAIASSVTLA